MTFVGRAARLADPGTAATDAPRTRPTVLFVSPVADFKGGAERVLLELLDNPRIRPALAVPGEGAFATLARARGIPLHFIDLGAVSTVHRPVRVRDMISAARAAWRCARQLAQAAAATDAALIHTNGLKVHVIGVLTRRMSSVPVVAHLHDIPVTTLEKTVWRGIAAGATRTILVSRPCFPGAKLPRHVGVVSNGVRAPAAMPPARVPGSHPTIGFVGRFHKFKGLHLLLDWFEQAAATRPDLRLLIRGRADQEGAAYWQSLEGRVARLCKQGRCRLLGWADAGEDPYEGIDLLAVPSKTPDPAPLVILEAMTRAIPCIGYPAGGIPALIGGPAHGALAADAQEFAAALQHLLDPGTYAAVSQAAAIRAREHFTIAQFWHNIWVQYDLGAVGLAGTERRLPTKQQVA